MFAFGIAALPSTAVPSRRRLGFSVRNTAIEEKDSSVSARKGPSVVPTDEQTIKTPKSPFKVVITGSTKGIGLELAREFLSAGDQVVISSRYDNSVTSAVEALKREFEDTSSINGITCDVTKQKEVADLADYCRDELGGVNFWINNAGNALREILETNILGVMLSCKEAIRIMRDQEMNGHILNMDGAGRNGRPTPRFAAYGATKRAISQFNDSLCEELKLQNITNIGVHNLSPGMCTTELLMTGADTAQAKFFINCLAEHPSVAAKHLVPLVRQLPQDSTKNGIVSQSLEYLTPVKAFSQIFRRLVFQERKNRHLQED